jgi:4-hydroxy-tetrahydrodipicolinate reductase
VPIKILQVGLGPIGLGVVGEVLARPALELVGATDVDAEKHGRELGELLGGRRRTGVRVTGDLAKTLKATRPDVALLCTGSSLRSVLPDLTLLLKHKVAVISTTEELAFPGRSHPSLARRIDALAKRSRVAVLGTGVNPGFLMDALPIALTAVCSRVNAIEVERVQDARVRRRPFQLKIGVGLTPAEFTSRLRDGGIGHVGFGESISMIAGAMGWKLDRIIEEVHPKLASQPVAGGAVPVDTGQVAGLVQDGVGYRKGKPLVRLHLEAYVGAPTSYEAIRIAGDPPVSMRLEGGVHGDVATSAIVVNSIPKVLAAAPGLRTMLDLALPSWWKG